MKSPLTTRNVKLNTEAENKLFPGELVRACIGLGVQIRAAVVPRDLPTGKFFNLNSEGTRDRSLVVQPLPDPWVGRADVHTERRLRHPRSGQIVPELLDVRFEFHADINSFAIVLSQ